VALARMPGPDEVVLHVHGDKGQVGPLSRRALDEAVKAGQHALSDHVWMQGMTDWVPLSSVPEVFAGLDAPTEAPVAPGQTEDDRLDAVFGGLVQKSWDYLENHEFAGHIDEVFLGAIITSTLDNGYSLIDISSDGTHHFLRFQNMQDHSRIITRVTHLTGSLAISKVLGQRASLIVGYGEKVAAIGKVMSAVNAEMKSTFLQNADPGTVTVDGDLTTGYVYCQVDLYLSIDDYVARDYTIDYSKLTTHIGATTHALRKYLRGRFA
jgi:hypothetical protein